VNRQEALDRPALIPISLWRNRVFTSICINVFLIWGAFNAFEQMANFFFSEQSEPLSFPSCLTVSSHTYLRPGDNMLMGFFVPHIEADRNVILTAVIASISHLPMAVINPNWTNWALAFPPMFLNPMGADGLFTVPILLISSVFPAKMQDLAGKGIQHNLADW
jgi:hypothetical protein